MLTKLVRISLAASLLLAACGEENGNGDDAGPGAGMDGATGPGADGSTPGPDGSTLPDGATPPSDGSVTTMDGSGPSVCHPVTCGGLGPYQCGDCVDNDGDGDIDSQDGNCLGPCDNNETGFDLGIPGGDTPSCSRDCYYDGDQGSGNDGCNWDSRCDPLSPDSNPMCSYAPTTPSARCDDDLTTTCLENCPPLVPNGCDCFGCCNIRDSLDDPDNWVFIGSLDSAGAGTCTLDLALAEDTDACHPCTPHGDCANDCGRCELCLGRTDIPDDCFPPPPGTDGGPTPDGGTTPTDGGTVDERCPGGETPCGLPGDPACAEGFYCLTGCCTFFG